MDIKTERFNGPDLYGYVARPEQAASAGVLIFPTIFGINDFARGYADRLAATGLLAAVWDINSGLPLVTEYQECIRRARTLTDTGVAQMVRTWIDTLTARFALKSVGLLGFCIGGRFALLCAAQDKRVACCAMAYPSIEDPRLANQECDAVSLASEIACPVHLLQPGKDHVTSAATYDALKNALFKRNPSTTFQYHPDAEHGFFHRETPEANRRATSLASPQVVAFLQACLN
jgi:carboxymethylenebutenolidase